MQRVLESILVEHEPRLLLLAALICVFGTVATLNVSGRVAGSVRSALWLFLLAVCAGCTVWATHFIAMLAYRQGTATTYDPGLTALSFVAGSVIMGLGFRLAIHGSRSAALRLLGGATLGAGVVVLHYVGMAALRMPGGFTYTPGMAAVSIVLSLGLGAPALAVAFAPRSPHARLLGASLMTVMVLALHFTAMAAVHVHTGIAAGVAASVTRSVLATAVAVASASVLLIGVIGAVIDQRVTNRLAAEADRFRTLADGAFEALVVLRAGVIVDTNAVARRLLGVAEGDAGGSLGSWLATAGASADDGDGAPALEVEVRRADGSSFPAEVCRRRILLSDGGVGELCAIRDLTARKESEARIAHLALHDPLTDLPNRRFFMELASRTIAHAQRSGERLALIALDLDDFKYINDTYGHAAGDEVMRTVAARIGATIRSEDIVARFGGDEFVILQPSASEAAGTTVLAERVLDALREPVQLDYGEVTISASMGLAFHPEDGRSVEDLLRNADTAMYRAKADGKATSRFFEANMDAAMIQRRILEKGMRRAVAERRFTVAYQPIADSHTRATLGFEALARWHDPELGEVTPVDFIPVAEETGMIVAIGEVVLRQACRDAITWPEGLRVAVNLSAVQFRRPGLLDMVRSALAESGLPGDRLDLEVTETLLMDNRLEALRQLDELRALGVRISMDDFGTGYSALSYLQSFPFDKIKIDRVFITDVASNAQNESIVRAVAAIGRSLEMRVVAEGVETDEQADLLSALDCDEIQGRLLARPMPAAEVAGFLDRQVAHSGPPRAARVATGGWVRRAIALDAPVLEG